MQYVDFGNTGVKVSRLGFGCMRLPMTEAGGKRVVDEDAAVTMFKKGAEMGINYFDSGYVYHYNPAGYAYAVPPQEDNPGTISKIPAALFAS